MADAHRKHGHAADKRKSIRKHTALIYVDALLGSIQDHNATNTVRRARVCKSTRLSAAIVAQMLSQRSKFSK